MKKRLLLILFLIAVALVFIVNGNYGAYSVHQKSWPLGSEPMDFDWQYLTKVVINHKKPFALKENKSIQVFVVDKESKQLLEKQFYIESAFLSSEIYWENFNEIVIEFTEEGTEGFKEDEYNRELLASGQRLVKRVVYHYDSNENKFKESAGQ